MVGYATFSKADASLDYICINPAFRREGLGRQLVALSLAVPTMESESRRQAERENEQTERDESGDKVAHVSILGYRV